MSSLDSPRRPSRRRLLGLAGAGLLALATAGCFKPMYAETPDAATPSLGDQLSSVEVVFAAGRVSNEVRNELIFQLTGGAGNPVGAPYRLELAVHDNTVSAIVDPNTGLPEVELISVTADWRLLDAANPKVPLASDTASGKASIDSGYQRFARARAIRDAQNRSAKLVAELIKGQLASYFATHAPKS